MTALSSANYSSGCARLSCKGQFYVLYISNCDHPLPFQWNLKCPLIAFQNSEVSVLLAAG
uniref:Uncharacterized protein n=1 Tax=Anguilla anguilla TaxID=7936 RepID=A0A0E9R2D5_ANGAN